MDPQSEAVCACRTRRRKLVYITLFFGAISSIVSLVYIYRYDPNHRISSLAQHDVVISAGPFEASSIYTVQSGQLAVIQVNVQGRKENALDMQKLPDGSILYILIDSPDHFVTNMYKVSKTGDVQKITNTDTVKYNLSVSPLGTKAVFQEGVVLNVKDLLQKNDWKISQTDLLTNHTEQVTTGSQPHFVNATTYFVKKDENLIALSTEPHKTATSTKLLSLSNTRAYAQNTRGTRLAFYNNKTAHIDVFAITPNAGISYLASQPARIQPSALAFKGEDVIGIFSQSLSKDTGGITLINYSKSQSQISTIQNPKNLTPQRITSYE